MKLSQGSNTLNIEIDATEELKLTLVLNIEAFLSNTPDKIALDRWEKISYTAGSVDETEQIFASYGPYCFFAYVNATTKKASGKELLVELGKCTAEQRHKIARTVSRHASSMPSLKAHLRNKTQSFQHPSQNAMMEVFPSTLCQAIRTIRFEGITRGEVILQISYSTLSLPRFVLSMIILPEFVPMVAMELFGAKMQDNGTRRSVILEGGAIFSPVETGRLGGAEDGRLPWLGSKLCQAILKGPQREMEIQENELRTSAVTLEINGNRLEGGQLNVDLGAADGSELKRLLFDA